MRKIMLLLAASMLTTVLFAQQVTGITHGEDGKPLPGATLTLLSAKDSALVKSVVSKDNGQFTFTGVKNAKYLLAATHIGFQPRHSAIFEVSGSDVTLPVMTMKKGEGGMQGVTVVAKKPVIEVKADKTILNVEGTVNAIGQDALELLRKSPGVLVDKDDNLSLSGKNGVQVYIDGRQTPLSGTDLSNFLKTLQSSNIEAIEVITNPSAKYDAAGNAGIINIRLKKNKSFGTNGSANAGWNIGTFAKYNTGISLNHRNRNINVFGNYNFNQSKNISYMNFYRKVNAINATQQDTTFDGTGYFLFKGTTHSFKAGADYTLSKKSVLGAIVSGNFTQPASIRNYSATPILYGSSNMLDRTLIADNETSQNRGNINTNLNYTYTEANGKNLTLNADYGHYDIDQDQLQPNQYYNPAGALLYSRIYQMITPSQIDIYALKGDYEQNWLDGKLGLGFKKSYTETDNDFQYYNMVTGGKTIDKDRSNLFYYKEHINAVYGNFNKQTKKGFMFQLGLRVENTVSKGTSHSLKNIPDSSFKRNYTDFFPSAAVTFNKNPMNQFSLTYSRRIDRPAYQDLNPFEFRLNEYSYMKGNTRLRPQYTNSFGITNTYKYKLTSTLNYSHVADIFTQLPDTIEKSKALMSKSNLATQDIVSLNISYPFMYKAFMSFINLNTYYSKYKANLGGAGRQVNLNVFSANVYMQNTLKFGKTWTAEISGFYTSPSIWQGTFKSKAMGSIDAGLQKTILAGKATVKAAVSDVFRTMRYSGESTFAGQYVRASGRWESRLLKLSFVYRFGNTQVKAARQRTTGADEESKRTQSSSGAGGMGQ